jgi:hypothetical protein
MPDSPDEVTNVSDTQPDQTTAPTPDTSQSAQPQAQPSPTPQPQPGQNELGDSLPQPQANTPPASTSGMVSNAPTPPATPAAAPVVHPAIRRASILNQIAQTLAGGPRYTVHVDDSGNTTRTPVPLSGPQIGMAIALEAISGSLTGLSQRGPESAARGGAIAFSNAQQQGQQRRALAEQQAQTDAANRSSALQRQAATAHVNAQTIAAVSEAEMRGQDAILKLADFNRTSGILDVDQSLLDNNGQPMTQMELNAAMQSGKLSSLDSLGPVAGATEVTNRDGSKHWESTHLIIKDPESKIALTPELAAHFKEQGVPGFQSANPGATAQVPLRMMQSWNETAASHYLATQRLSDLRTTLAGTPLADKVPTSIDFTKPGVATAMSRFRYYTSHNSDNLSDPYLALQAQGADKRNPKTGAMEPNPDAKYVDTIAQTFGGWPLLEAAHNQILAQRKSAADFAVIDSADKANAVLAANPTRFSADQRSSAANFLRLANAQGAAKAGQDARARAIAEGSDIQAMYRYGRNPISGEQLSLLNAPDAMLVNGSGQVIPQDLVSTYKPTGQERQTADTARQVLAISDRLKTAVAANPNLVGPLAGRSKQGLAKAGLGDAQSQEFLDDLSFLQTASVKMHTGRFSVPVIDKMNQVIKPGMNVDQFNGALQSINDVAGLYKDEDKLVSVGQLKATQNQAQQLSNTLSGKQPLTNIQVNPNTHQRIGWNGKAWVDVQTLQGVK